MFWNWKQRFGLTAWVGHANKLHRGFFPEESGAFPDSSRASSSYSSLQTVNPRIAMFWPHAARPAARDQIKMKKLLFDSLLPLTIPPFTASLPRALSVDLFKQRIPRAIERRFQSAEHNARRMTTPTFKFVQIPRVYVRVFR